MKHQQKVFVGITDYMTEVSGYINGNFYYDFSSPLSGFFSAKVDNGAIVLLDHNNREICRSPWVRLKPREGSTFSLKNVIIGKDFHWNRIEDQTFYGDLILKIRNDQTIAVINEISLEDYLKSVISSEMNPSSPIEFLKAHAILSRSWILSTLDRKKRFKDLPISSRRITDEEVITWYDNEDHDLYDFCADDHCQRYHGISKIKSHNVEDAVRETNGLVITYGDQICDTRYSKVCGGMTEEFKTAWNDKQIPFLVSISDSEVPYPPIINEDEAKRWILFEPQAYCNIKDENLLKEIFTEFDFETKNFFRWSVEYSRNELEDIIREKSGFDFGFLKEIIPLKRGPSGRISRLKIIGSKRSMIVGKELEIRRWLSRSHLYSSAFIVTNENDRFIFHGAGWGHGVGLCQLGAAVMATKGFSAEKILKHYFRGVEVKKYGKEVC